MIRIAIERVATARVAKLPIARTILISVRHTSVFRSMQVESWGWNDIDVLPALTEVFIIVGEKGASWPGGRLPLFLLKIQF